MLRRVVIWVLAVAVALALIIGVMVQVVWPRLEARAEKTTSVWTETAAVGDLTERVAAPGVVEPLTKVEISARVSARIIRLPYDEGDRVSAGGADGPSVLVELDASDIEARLESAQKRRDALVAQVAVEKKRIAGLEASLAGVKIVLADARRELERQAALRATGDVSMKAAEQAQRAVEEAQSRYNADLASLEGARLGLEVSRLNIEAAEADIRQIREELIYTTITTPIDGVVTRRNVDVGEIAVTGTMNNPGTVLLEVADLSRMLVVARIDESHIRDVAPGQLANVYIDGYPDQLFTGRVRNVALAATGGQGRYFETQVLLDENNYLQRTGMSADVEVEVRAHTDRVLAPNQSVVSRPIDDLPSDIRLGNPLIDATLANTIVVFGVEAGKAVAIPVRIGASDSLNTIVEAGLDAGAEIVTGPYAVLESLKHGDKVTVGRRDGVDVTPKPDADTAAAK